MKRIFNVVAMVAAIGLGSSALAQSTGTRLGKVIPRTKPEQVFDLMAQCFATRYPQGTAEYLRILPGSPEQTLGHRRMSGALDVCLNSPDFAFEGDQLEFDGHRFHRGLGYFLVRTPSYRAPVTLPGASDAPVWFAGRQATATPEASYAMGLEQFGHCVAQRNWTVSRQLVVAKPGSKEEKAATKALQPDLNACLSLGDILKLDRKLFPHIIGDAMFHIADRARAVDPAKGT